VSIDGEHVLGRKHKALLGDVHDFFWSFALIRLRLTLCDTPTYAERFLFVAFSEAA